MRWKSLNSRDRNFIRKETDRVIKNMNANAEFMATYHSFEKAKERMNQAFMAAKLEDDPDKQAILIEMTEKYIEEANEIYERWETERRRELRWHRRVVLCGWIFFLCFFGWIFPINIILFIFFLIWFVMHYIVHRNEYKK